MPKKATWEVRAKNKQLEINLLWTAFKVDWKTWWWSGYGEFLISGRQTAFVSITPSPLSVYFTVTRIGQVWGWQGQGPSLNQLKPNLELQPNIVLCPIFFGFPYCVLLTLIAAFSRVSMACLLTHWTIAEAPLMSCLFPQFWLCNMNIYQFWPVLGGVGQISRLKLVSTHWKDIWKDATLSSFQISTNFG